MNLNIFDQHDFLSALKVFFKDLKVPVNYIADEPVTPKNILSSTYRETEAFQLMNDVYFVGMIDDAAFAGNKSPEVSSIRSDYDGILIFGVELKRRANGLLPTRGQLAEISRAFNREFHFTPVVVIFKYNGQIAFANTERIKYKQGWREGEKTGKVSVLRDVNIQSPHRGHLEILKELEIPTSGKNVVDSFATLYKYWQEVFSVSILNKKFYNELQNWYFWAIKEVSYPNAPNRFDFETNEKFDEALKEHKGKNVIRLLTRILFIWFIKEKKLIPEQLFDEKFIANKLIKDFTPQKPRGVFATGKQNSTYYRAILQNLFFATLNQEMGKRAFRGEGQHQNVTNLMRYKSYFKDPEYFVQMMEEVVPFMNGGLFECLDKPHPTIKGKQGGDIIIYNDGFSDRDDNLLVVPDYLFFDVDEDVDLSDDFGNKVYKNSKTRGLLEILLSYKFTITENTPIEEDVALDPELLGKVFENLLASYNPETKTTARKQTGSFYTPREIVNYMVDESLIAYLKNTLHDVIASEEQLDQDLHQLLSYDTINPYQGCPEIQKQIIKALDQCTILDPACGSGAFPMGILQKMVHVLHKIDPKNTEWEQRQIDRVNKAIENLEEIDDVRFREQSIKELKAQIKDIEDSFENNELDYGRKLYLIENCIYGVDIQSIATQISKLRFFISLIVDQKIDKTKENFGIRPLPNLETKFVAANTLIGIEKPKAQLNLFENQEIKKLEAELKKVRHKLFSSKSPTNKRKLREEDKELRNRIADLLVNDGWEYKTARQLASWDPYDQNESSPFFDPEWMFDIKVGFDIVIGNPPYIRLQGVQDTSPEFIPYAKRWYVSAQKGNWDLYVIFTEAGYIMLKPNGILSFIQPHKFFQGDFGVGIRNLIAKERCLYQIIHFGAEQMFESATNYTCLFFIQKQVQKNFKYLKIDEPNEWLNNTSGVTKHILPQPQENEKWNFACGAKQSLLEKLKKQPQKLEDVTRKIFVGLQTSCDKIYVLKIKEWREKTILVFSTILSCEVEIERGIVKPFLMGKDVKRYEKPNPTHVVIFPYHIQDNKALLMTQNFIKEHYPLCWQYLLENRSELENREKGKMMHDNFYAYIYPKNLMEFDAVKLLTPEIAIKPQLSLDSAGVFYHTTKVYSFVFKENINEKQLYWLGVLNSQLLWFFLNTTGYVLRGDYYTFKTEYLKPFPVKRIDFKNKNECFYYEEIIDKVTEILILKQKGQDTDHLEKEIDQIVFKLYGLTYEEVKVIVPNFWISEEEYFAMEVN